MTSYHNIQPQNSNQTSFTQLTTQINSGDKTFNSAEGGALHRSTSVCVIARVQH